MTNQPSDRAQALAASGRAREGAALLAEAAQRGDADAAFSLAIWTLTGHPVPRDLAAARRWFCQSGELGRADADAIATAFLASGIGGTRDWQTALRNLRRAGEQLPAARRQLSLIEAMAVDAKGDPTILPAGTKIGGPLPIERFDGFCTPAECDYLADTADPLFEPAVVADPRTGLLIRNPVRTSDSAAFPIVDETPAIHAINRRIAAASRTAPEQGEPLQVLRYAPGQEYRPHSDALPGGDNQRILTMLIYLNDGFGGGGTRFVETGLTIVPRMGDAILFANTCAGRPDMRMVHAGLPVTRGTKLLATRWIRERPLLG